MLIAINNQSNECSQDSSKDGTRDNEPRVMILYDVPSQELLARVKGLIDGDLKERVSSPPGTARWPMYLHFRQAHRSK